MSLDLMLGKTTRRWDREENVSSWNRMGSIAERVFGTDPLVWTPSAVRAELDRVRNLLDVVNQEMTLAMEDKKISGSEWGRWAQTYRSTHQFLNRASPIWGSNVKTVRLHEQEIAKWRRLLQKRGARQTGPADLGRVPGGLGLSALLLPALAGAATTLGIVLYLKKKKT